MNKAKTLAKDEYYKILEISSDNGEVSYEKTPISTNGVYSISNTIFVSDTKAAFDPEIAIMTGNMDSDFSKKINIVDDYIKDRRMTHMILNNLLKMSLTYASKEDFINVVYMILSEKGNKFNKKNIYKLCNMLLDGYVLYYNDKKELVYYASTEEYEPLDLGTSLSLIKKSTNLSDFMKRVYKYYNFNIIDNIDTTGCLLAKTEGKEEDGVKKIVVLDKKGSIKYMNSCNNFVYYNKNSVDDMLNKMDMKFSSIQFDCNDTRNIVKDLLLSMNDREFVDKYIDDYFDRNAC